MLRFPKSNQLPDLVGVLDPAASIHENRIVHIAWHLPNIPTLQSSRPLFLKSAHGEWNTSRWIMAVVDCASLDTCATQAKYRPGR